MRKIERFWSFDLPSSGVAQPHASPRIRAKFPPMIFAMSPVLYFRRSSAWAKFLRRAGVFNAGMRTQLTPRPNSLRRPWSVTKQEFAESMSGTQFVALRCLAGTHQVTQRLVCGVGHPHHGELSRPVTARQLLRISPVGLHSIARLRRNQARRHHLAAHAKLDKLPVQHVAARPRLVADSQFLDGTQLLDELAYRVRPVWNRPKRPYRRFSIGTATAMLSACTSRPPNLILFFMTGSFRM